MIYRSAIQQPDGKQEDCCQRERRLRQSQEYAEELHAERDRHEDYRPDKLTNASRRKCEHADKIVEVIKVLEQAFHLPSISRLKGAVPHAAEPCPTQARCCP